MMNAEPSTSRTFIFLFVRLSIGVLNRENFRFIANSPKAKASRIAWNNPFPFTQSGFNVRQ
jgi:hypothetical protein